MQNSGVVLKRLRVLKQLSVEQAAKTINRSVGWLSEVEAGKGYSRLKPEEFERIIKLYDGESLRAKFSGWIGNEIKQDQKQEISFDGAILKYLREKAGLSITEAARKLHFSKCYLSALENGHKVISLPGRPPYLVPHTS